ncbi:MAG: hypothetical protein ACYDB0_00830 [Acidithiobacillus sp.]
MKSEKTTLKIDDINSLEHCYALWDRYVIIESAHDRAAFIHDVLKEERTADDWRRIDGLFAPDRQASMQIFRPMVNSIIREDMALESDQHISFTLVSDNILDLCRSSASKYGRSWDMDKAAIAYDSLISAYQKSDKWMLDMLERAARQNDHFEGNMRSLSAAIAAAPPVARFSVPVLYAFSEDTDEMAYVGGYPDESLRKVERDFLLINHENGLAGDYNGLPLRTHLSIGGDGRTALFTFTATDKYTADRRKEIVESAKEWLLGQLSDGFAEDMTRHEVLVGHRVLTPMFRERDMEAVEVEKLHPTLSKADELSDNQLEQAFHHAFIRRLNDLRLCGTVAYEQARNEGLTAMVRALVKDANANDFALVTVPDAAFPGPFAVPVSDIDRDRLTVGNAATFRVVEGAKHCAVVAPSPGQHSQPLDKGLCESAKSHSDASPD